MNTIRPGRPRETSHEHIRQTAFGLFSERGYAATPLSLIASKVGISRTTLFSYFPAKHELLWEDFESSRDRLQHALEQTDSMPVVDMIATAILAYAEPPATDRHILRLRWQLATEDPELRAYASARTERLMDELIDSLQKRIPSVDEDLTRSVARAIHAVAALGVETWARSGTPDDDLGALLSARMAPFVTQLRPLLP